MMNKVVKTRTVTAAIDSHAVSYTVCCAAELAVSALAVGMASAT